MPKPTQQAVSKSPLGSLEVQSKPEETKVVARAVDPGTLKGYDSSLDATLKGLSMFNGKLSEYVNDQADRDVVEGMKIRADGAPLDGNKGEWIKHGFMVMDGRVKGAQDGASLLQAYQTGFDKDAGNLDQFISKQWSEQTKGLQDKSFLTGYSAAFGSAAQELRKEHSKFQTEQVVAKHESNVLFQIDQQVRSNVERGQPIDVPKLDTLKGELKQMFGTSGTDWNELLFKSIKRIGDEGNPAVYSIFKEKNTDGTPGMYYIPKWKTHIDAAEIHAQNEYLTKQSRLYELEKRTRDERQDTALYGVFEKLYGGDQDGAQADFGKHVSSGLFSRASDIVKWQEMFRKVEHRELRGDEQTKMTEALTGIYSGKIGIRDILQLGLPPKETRQLLAEQRVVAQDERKAHAQGFTAENRPFHDHRYKEQDDYLEKQLAPIQDFLGKFTGKNEFITSARATAKLELAEYVKANGLKDIRTKTLEIVERHQKRIATQGDDIIDRSAKQLRYSTVGESKAAYERGEMGDADFALHLNYFENRLKTVKPSKGTNGK